MTLEVVNPATGATVALLAGASASPSPRAGIEAFTRPKAWHLRSAC